MAIEEIYMTEENITNSSLIPSIEPSGMPTGMPTDNQTIPIDSSSSTKSENLGYIVMGVIGFCICTIFAGVIAYIKYKSILNDKVSEPGNFDNNLQLANLGESTIFENQIPGEDISSSGWSE